MPQDIPTDPLSTALQALLAAHTRAQSRLALSLGVRRGDVDALEHLMVESRTPGELARCLGVTAGAVTQLVQRLELRGHAQRTIDEHDGRRTQVTLTPTGRQTVIDHVLPMLEQLDQLADSLSTRQSSAVLAYLKGAERSLLSLADTPQE